MDRGVDLSRETIRAIIKDAGYRWRKAREVLTSNDPEYREKLKRVTAVLSALKPGEYVFLQANVAVDGTLSTSARIQVSKDGVKPPQ